MRILTLLLLLQTAVPPQREILGPYTYREDQGQTTKVVLKNGLTVIVREEQAVPLASITTLVKAGYLDEDDKLSGISNVVERMIFDKEISDEARAIGASLQSSSNYDRTVYNTVLNASRVIEGLGIQAHALQGSPFDAEDLKRQVEEIIQLNHGNLDNPSAVASQKLYETAFTTHRIRRSPTGADEGLRALTRDDVVAFHEKFYQPSNMILSVVGAFDREKVLKETVELYGSVGNVQVEHDSSPAEPPQEGLRYSWRRGPVRQAYVAMGFHVPGMGAADARSLEVLAAILGGGRASRLSQIVRDEKTLITTGSASLRTVSDFGYFELDLQTPSPLEAEIAALAEIENIKRFDLSPETVGRAKLVLARNYYEGLQSVEAAANDLVSHEALGDWKRSLSYVADIQNVTPQRVRDAARKYLTLTNLTVVEYLPESVERYFSVAEYRAAVVDKVEAAVERHNEAELPVVQAPPRNLAGADTVAAIQRRSILRGPEVYILEDHRLPIVSFGIFFPGGRLMETERNAGITELMLRSALRGAGNMSSSELLRRIENAGASIEVVNEPDFFGYVLHGFSGRMDGPLKVLIDILQNPTFDEVQVANEQTLQLVRIQSLKDDAHAFPLSLFKHALFSDHAYAREATGTSAGIEMLTGVHLRQWLKDNFRKLLPTIVIVGDTSGTGLVAPIAEALTNEDLQSKDILAMPKVQPASESGQSAENTGGEQTALVYGFPGVNRSSNDRYAFDLLANILSEDRAIAGNVETANAAYAKGGTLYSYAAFSPGREAETRALLDKSYASIRSSGVSGESFRNAVQQTIGRHDAALQTRSSRVMEYARALYSGAGVQSVTGYGAAVQKVTSEQLKSVVGRYLDPAGLRMGIARGGAR